MKLNPEIFDMTTDLDQIQKLVDQKDYPAALEAHIWFHENILDHDPSNVGVRSSFALSDWVKLGSLYPPAIVALEEIRDREEQKCRNKNFSDEESFRDAVSINRSLDQSGRSISLFEELGQSKSDLAKRYWPIITRCVINEERYDLLAQYGFDFEKELAHLERCLNQKKSLQAGSVDFQWRAIDS